jgi:hypothetical protein
MSLRRWITALVVAIFIALCVAGLLAFAHTFAPAKMANGESTKCFDTILTSQSPKWLGCTMAAHENLAGGLLGAGGALFAAWLAYTATQLQIQKAELEARRSRKLIAEEKLLGARQEIEDLRDASAYLADFAANFPPWPNHKPTTDLSDLLCELHRRALVYVSASASRAPYGFGKRISTVMWRMETIAGRIEDARSRGVSEQERRATWKDTVEDGVAAIRKLVQEIQEFLPKLEDHLANLKQQTDNIQL